MGMIFLVFIVGVSVGLIILITIACAEIAGRCSRMEEEWEYRMALYKQEYMDLEQEFLDGRISDKEFLKRYNELKEKESNDMIKSDGLGEPHEHI